MSDNFAELAGSFDVVGCEIRHLESTDSTMNDAWTLAEDGARDGMVVVADHQSAGRGRYDRSWVSNEAQDILCSVVVRPRVALAGELLMLAALAVTDVADSYGISSGIKWPNDVQVQGKKLSGVIAESRTGPGLSSGDAGPEQICAVIGIGLNVNLNPKSEFAGAPNSTSLASELGEPVDRLQVFSRLLGSLDSHYSSLTAGGTLVPAWRDRLTTLGRNVTVTSGVANDDSTITGVAEDVDSIGRLIVRDADGRARPVSAGEVSVQNIE